MRQLTVDYDKILTFNARIDAIRNKQNDVAWNNETRRGKINGVPSRHGHLANAANELYTRQSTVENRQDALESFKNQVTCFADEAYETDHRVASRIKNEHHSFCYDTGIAKPSWWQGVWNGVKEWYDENSWWIDWVVDGLLVAAAVFALFASFGGGLIFLAAAWFALAKASADFFTSTVSAMFRLCGDRAKSDQWAEYGLKDGFLFVGRAMDSTFGTTIFEGFAGVLYSGCEIFSAVVTVVRFGESLLKAFNLDKTKWKNVFTGNWGKGWDTTRWFNSIDWGGRFTPGNIWKGLKTLPSMFGFSFISNNASLSMGENIFVSISKLFNLSRSAISPAGYDDWGADIWRAGTGPAEKIATSFGF